MTARIPDINVIQDTPTSPNHGPVQIYESPGSVLEANLPEVDENSREGEGLQVDPNGPYPQPTTGSKSKQVWAYYGPESEKQVPHDDAGLIPTEESIRRDRTVCGLKRRTFFIIVAIATIVIICAAIGGGVGGYYATKTKDSPTSTGPVTSGTTGMAALPCNDAKPGETAQPRGISNPWQTIGATFNITCGRGLPATGDRKGRPITNLHRWTIYNITTCMDLCANDTTCGGIVYGANLTDMVADGDPGGNCLLKNNTWDAVSQKEEWFASAVKL